MKDYKRKYEEALERAKKYFNDEDTSNYERRKFEVLFPELKENEDEKIKHEIKVILANTDFSRFALDYTFADMINWLEKQVEQKSADKVEPKFKVGDWITFYGDKPFKILKIEAEQNGILDYLLLGQNGYDSYYNKKYVDEKARLWTIQDAKDGDIIYHKGPLTGIEYIIMSKGINSYGAVDSYFRYHSNDGFGINVHSVFNAKLDKITPATKEQCDLLFKKMKEAGYEWDANKKELKKIEQSPAQETEPLKTEHGKYYYCIKDYFYGGKKQASKGDVVQALRGLPIMGLKDASEYFLPVNFIECNSAWSEEDEYQINTILHGLDLKRKLYKKEGNQTEEERYKTQYDWLKSLKDRVQPNKEWSEEDEKMLEEVCSNVKFAIIKRPTLLKELGEKQLNWLKSLKPNHWKPSEYQISWLEKAIPQPDTELGNEMEYALKSLYNDLLKL